MELNFLPDGGTMSWSGRMNEASARSFTPVNAQRPFSSLEIEITTRCNLFCPSCPRATYRRSWINQDMCLDNFEKIAASFPLYHSIYFRGWGEPTLNPDFDDMIRIAHASGARVILSTNGIKPLNPDLLPLLDAVIFRLDYGRAATYERRNPGSRFNRVIFNISQAIHWRKIQGAATPRYVVLFAKNRFSLAELPEYLETATRLRPDRVVFYQPSFHVRPVDERGQLSADLNPGLLKKIDRILEYQAESAEIDLINQPLDADPAGRCAFDPVRAMFVNWSGRVALCRDSALPVANGRFNRFYGGLEEPLETTLFGSLIRHPLEEVLQDRCFRTFRRACLSADGCGGADPRIASGQAPASPIGNLVFIGKSRLRSCRCYRR